MPIADRVRIGVAIFSYRDTLTFGLTGDHASAPDLDLLTEANASRWRSSCARHGLTQEHSSDSGSP